VEHILIANDRYFRATNESGERHFDQHWKSSSRRSLDAPHAMFFSASRTVSLPISQVHVLQFDLVIDDTSSEAAETLGDT
jgi:hypothetical protein